jgi:hypothetical protein
MLISHKLSNTASSGNARKFATGFGRFTLLSGRRVWVDSPNERRLWLAPGVSEVQNQRQISIVNGDAGDINDARDALLMLY